MRFAQTVTALGWRDFVVAINLSPKQFNNQRLCQLICDNCSKYDIELKNVDLEITEGLLMDDSENSARVLSELSEAGFKISIDDFGTGYSSLAYLPKFPLDTLKIDRSFVIDLPGNADAVSISRAIIRLAHSLRLTVVAEGVETFDQLQLLQREACEFVQGYFISRPMPAQAFITWLNSSPRIDQATRLCDLALESS